MKNKCLSSANLFPKIAGIPSDGLKVPFLLIN